MNGRNVNYFKKIHRKTTLINVNGTLNKRIIHLAACLECKNDSDSSKLKKGAQDSDRILMPNIDQKSSTEIELHENRVDLLEIINEINRNYRVMICMRGAPGSGKSHLARTIIDRTVNDGNYHEHIFSADDHFYDRQTGLYTYDRTRLRQAHNSNKFRVARHAQNGWSPIIVDNTNMKLWEMFAYVKEGIRNGYVIKIIEPQTTWAQSIDELVRRNKHNVDHETIERMLSMYEPGTVTDILNALNLRPSQPKLRNFPKITNSNDGNRTAGN